MNNPNRRWREEEGYLALDARLFDEWNEICRICEDDEDPTCWCIVSKELGIEHDWLISDTLEEAKEECENMFTSRVKDTIVYYQELLNQWEETHQ